MFAAHFMAGSACLGFKHVPFERRVPVSTPSLCPFPGSVSLAEFLQHKKKVAQMCPSMLEKTPLSIVRNGELYWIIHYNVKVFTKDLSLLTQPMNHVIKSLNFIFPTNYEIPKSLKVGHWLSEFITSIFNLPRWLSCWFTISSAFAQNWDKKHRTYTLHGNLRGPPQCHPAKKQGRIKGLLTTIIP